MLNDTEQVLLQELINVFKPFDELTTYLSGIRYMTLSVVNPTIKALKAEFFNYDESILDELEDINESIFGKNKNFYFNLKSYKVNYWFYNIKFKNDQQLGFKSSQVVKFFQSFANRIM